MISIPFIYFGLLSVYLFKKRGLDASSYCVLLYAITSFFSIVLMSIDGEYSAIYSEEVQVTPMLVYCLYITAIILPLYTFNSNSVNRVTVRNEKFINAIAIYFFVSLVIIMLAYAKDFAERLFFASLEDMNDVKLSAQARDELKLTQYPAIITYPLKVLCFTSSMSYVSIFIYFFSKAYLKKSKLFNAITIIGSLTSPVFAMLLMDRSRTIWWLLIFGLCFSLFWRHLSGKSRKDLKKTSFVVIGILAIYIISVSIARFAQNRDGTSNALVSYAGMSYPNFCYFYNNFTNPDGFTGKVLFPVTNSLFTHNAYADVGWQKELTIRTGIDTGVFYSFVGTIYVGEGLMGLIIFFVLYYLLWMFLFPRHKKYMSFEKLFCLFLLMIIPSTGSIAYFGGYTINITTALLLLFMFLYSRKILF